MPANTTGVWSPTILQWPVMPIHALVTQDGRVLTFGTDQNGVQGATMYHAIWDPVTGTHTLIDHHTHTPTDIFCAAAVIMPGTNDIIITGGDARPEGHVNDGVDDVNLFNLNTLSIKTETHGDMAYARWYQSSVAMPNGQILVVGGIDGQGVGVRVPEIFTPGVGWTTLTGATGPTTAIYYPRMMIGGDGKVVYFGGDGGSPQAIMKLDTTGIGSVTQIGTLPFIHTFTSPAVQYAPGKMLVNDATTGLWTVDINGASPVVTRVGTLSQNRDYANMTVLANGTVLITGGSSGGNTLTGADKTATIWDPRNNSLVDTVDEAYARLYHSTAILLPDGSVLSGGGGAPGPETHLDAQIYRPAYLYDASGNLATRPVITSTPDHMEAGSTFQITVDNAAAIQRLTFVKNGAVTHNYNMETRAVDLAFTVGPNNTLNVTLPGVAQGVTSGSWMLFAWNNAGVPSIAPVLEVDPIFGTGGTVKAGNLLTNGSFETAAAFAEWKVIDTVIGWQSTNNNFELWKDGHIGVRATDGRTFMEIDAERGTVSQSVATKAGSAYDIVFDFKANPGNIASSKMDVLWNNQVVGTINPTDTSLQTLTYTVAGTGGRDTLAFRAVAGDDDWVGGLLDNVIVKAGSGAPPAGSRIDVTAAGQSGFETMQLIVKGAVVGTYGNVSSGGQTFTYNATGTVTANDVRVAFTNDRYDPVNGIDYNLLIDKIVIDGTTYQTEAAGVFSTGTWKAADGISPGFGRGDTLHSNGYFQYATGTGGGTIVDIFARGQTGNETMQLRIDGQVVATYANVSAAGQTLQYNAIGAVTASQVRLDFTNDRYDPANAIDYNLTVDRIALNGVAYQTEATSVYSTGVWNNADGIVAGYGRGETLATNGYFQFGAAGAANALAQDPLFIA